MSDPAARIRSLIADNIQAHQRFSNDGVAAVVAAAGAISKALTAGHKVLAFGNGGSAADAQHFIAELVGRFEHERPGLPGISLTTDTSILTAVANDYGYDKIFTRQVEALGVRGDVAFGISTSGKSPNVLAALELARARGLVTIALTGRDGGPIGKAVDVHLNVAESSTARVQEVHITIIHAICALIDAR
jgi:D-sedoheptulose 7-phosphate isomerase